MKNLKIFPILGTFILSGFAFGQINSPGAVIINNPTVGEIGIGINPPLHKLHVFEPSTSPVSSVLFDVDHFYFGNGNTVTGSQYAGALGLGNTVVANSYQSFALGFLNTIEEAHGVAAIGGGNMISTSEESAAIGERNQIFNGHGTIALGGHNVSNGTYTITIGEGLNNNTTRSLMAGFSGIPTLYVDNNNRVGIGNMTSPQEALHVNGRIRASSLAGGGNICSDALGNLYISGPCGGGGGDDLGNHLAIMDLDMNCNNILNSADIKFCNGQSIDQTSIPGELIINGAVTMAGPPGGSGYVLWVNGSANAPGGWWTISDQRYKTDIQNISSANAMLKNLNGYSYSFNHTAFPELNLPKERVYGFMAQELEAIMPEAVNVSPEGLYTVNYDMVVPLLTEAIKEQQTVIEDHATETEALKSEVEELRSLVNSICQNGCGDLELQQNNSNTNNQTIESRLDDNSPNPFYGYTTIGFFVKDEATSAYISINDLSGKFITKHNIMDFGVDGQINIESNDQLTAGIYLYSLVVDNKVIDSKKMIISAK